MNYTVISKSGWQGDFWRIRKTFQNKEEAEDYANSIKAAEATEDGYHVVIKSHHKSLAQLMTRDDDIKFADGTRAEWNF